MATHTASLLHGLAIAAVACVLAACSPPGPPDEERRPEPKAQPPGERQPRSAIVRDAEAYKDRARGAESASLEAADRQREAIEAATD